MIQIEGTKPVSAGFCVLGTDETVSIAPEGSDSLNMGPTAGDRELIISTLANTGIYAFMAF